MLMLSSPILSEAQEQPKPTPIIRKINTSVLRVPTRLRRGCCGRIRVCCAAAAAAGSAPDLDTAGAHAGGPAERFS
jgi:hypothetical protein